MNAAHRASSYRLDRALRFFCVVQSQKSHSVSGNCFILRFFAFSKYKFCITICKKINNMASLSPSNLFYSKFGKIDQPVCFALALLGLTTLKGCTLFGVKGTGSGSG